jgi:hypothetical protein
MLDIRNYFDEGLNLNEGDKIFIPCDNEKQQASIRSQLNRMRKDYGKKHDFKIMEYMGVYIQEIDKKHYVIIEKRNKVDNAFIKRANGSIHQITTEANDDK